MAKKFKRKRPVKRRKKSVINLKENFPCDIDSRVDAFTAGNNDLFAQLAHRLSTKNVYIHLMSIAERNDFVANLFKEYDMYFRQTDVDPSHRYTFLNWVWHVYQPGKYIWRL